MKTMFRCLWTLLAVVASVNFAWQGMLSFGAWLELATAPDIPIFQQAAAFIIAAIFMVDAAFPSLRSHD